MEIWWNFIVKLPTLDFSLLENIFFDFTAVPCYLLLFIYYSSFNFDWFQMLRKLPISCCHLIVYDDPLCSCDVSWCTSILLWFESCSFFFLVRLTTGLFTFSKNQLCLLIFFHFSCSFHLFLFWSLFINFGFCSSSLAFHH